MFKKTISLMLALMLVVGLFAGCGAGEESSEGETSGEKVVMGMITDTGGLGDQSFNDSAWAGLEMAEKDHGIERKVLESASEDDYYPNLTAFAQEDVELIIGVGFLFKESMTQAAEKFPEQKFAIVDETVEADNVASIKFAEHEGSYLVGVIAGLATETNKIGFVGGMKFPLIEKFEYGFRAGVKSVNPDAEVIVNYAESFSDAAKGKEIALVQHQDGADVIFHAAGGVGIGVIKAAAEKDFWAIGVDQDQSALAPENVLCSMVKRVDVAVATVADSIMNENFKSGVNLFDLSNEGVGYSDKAGNLTDELKSAADKYAEAVKAGDIVVPSTADEFETFEAPSL